jgi:pimeloyl-ACP methyl ester carboxylesterase
LSPVTVRRLAIARRELDPGVILVHGGMKVSHSFGKLAAALSSFFTVYLPDRRGRGLSGPHGDRFGVMREVEDMQAIVAKTEACGPQKIPSRPNFGQNSTRGARGPETGRGVIGDARAPVCSVPC